MKRILVNYWTDINYRNGGSFIVEGTSHSDDLNKVLETEVPDYHWADYWDLDKYPDMEYEEEIKIINIWDDERFNK